MKTLWTQHLKTEDERKNFKQTVLNSRSTLERLNEIIDARLRTINSIETGVDIYTKPGWDALLAHYNGEKATLTWVKTLTNLDQEGD